MKQPKPKLVEVQVKIKNALVASYDGSVHSTPGGNRFVGIDAANTSAPVAQINFLDWRLRGAGQPSRTATTNMTIILKNHIAMKKFGVSWSLAPGYWKTPVSDRTIYRAKAAAKQSIRFVTTTTTADGRIVAIAFMHDGKSRDKFATSGPAWILFDGEKQAKFKGDLQITEE
ncbi:MAG: hypothetical protein KA535_10370 [Azonexus sp.]|nr:hypothetical protein [Azonexus sp.]